MSWSGGTYTKGNAATGGWVGDASLGIGIEAGRHDTQDNDFATGINQCLNKDGSNAATGNLNLGGFLPTNIGAGTAAAVAIAAGNDVNTGIFAPAADNWAVATNGAERIRIDSTGKVGIGTTAPADALEVATTSFFPQYWSGYPGASAGGANLVIRRSRGAAVGTNTILQNGDIVGSLGFQGANGTTFTQCATIGASIDGTPGASNDMPGRLEFYTTADGSGTPAERMRITSAGFVGIGNAGPGVLCDLARSANDTLTRLRIQNGDSGSSAECRIELGNNLNPSAVNLILNSSGNTANAGANAFHIFNGLSAPIRMRAGGSGGVDLASGATSWAAVSDSRQKKNIEPLSYGLTEIVNLNPIRFDYNDDESDDSKRLGFIAQDVKPIIPEAVNGSDDTFYTFSATELIPALVNAVKELSIKVETLEARVAELEAA